MSIIQWTRPARCSDCIYYESLGRGKKALCKLPNEEGYTSGKDKVCDKWKGIISR